MANLVKLLFRLVLLVEQLLIPVISTCCLSFVGNRFLRCRYVRRETWFRLTGIQSFGLLHRRSAPLLLLLRTLRGIPHGVQLLEGEADFAHRRHSNVLQVSVDRLHLISTNNTVLFRHLRLCRELVHVDL